MRDQHSSAGPFPFRPSSAAVTRRFDRARRLLAGHGLGASGLVLPPADLAPPGIRSLILATAAGHEAWHHFRESRESRDGQPHPLDRWSHRVINAVATELDGLAVFPNEGPPYWPFLRWARQAEPVWPSPLGMFVHADFGLWFFLPRRYRISRSHLAA